MPVCAICASKTKIVLTALRTSARTRGPSLRELRSAKMSLLSSISRKVSNASFFFCLISLVALPAASGQTLPPAGRFPEPLEKYEMMPPAQIYRLETSPRMISRYGPFTSFQVNVDANGNNIVGDAANEPSISVDPTDGNKMAIGWRQFDTWHVQFPGGRRGLHHRCRDYVAFPGPSG